MKVQSGNKQNIYKTLLYQNYLKVVVLLVYVSKKNK